MTGYEEGVKEPDGLVSLVIQSSLLMKATKCPLDFPFKGNCGVRRIQGDILELRL
jgi:hypothetical protein